MPISPLVVTPAMHYAACMDSVRLVSQLRTLPPAGMSAADVADTIARNVEHLKVALTRPYWTTENLAPFTVIINGGVV